MNVKQYDAWCLAMLGKTLVEVATAIEAEDNQEESVAKVLRYNIGDEVYVSMDNRVLEGEIIGVAYGPGYKSDYCVQIGRNKKYVTQEQVSQHAPVRSRKELYEAIGPEATKIIRSLRDQGWVDINLPPHA